MENMKTMTLAEKLDTIARSVELAKQGRLEDAAKLRRQAPLAPYLAKFLKDHLGLQALLDSGWNLSEAVAEYGPAFLSNRNGAKDRLFREDLPAASGRDFLHWNGSRGSRE